MKYSFNESLSRRNHGGIIRRSLPLIVPLVFLGFFFYFPLFTILEEGIRNEAGKVSLSNLASILGEKYYRKVILFTVEQAILSTIFSLLLGLPGAYIFARYHFRGKSFIKAVFTVPFILPSIIVVLGFVIFFGNNGVLNRALMNLLGTDSPPLKILYSMKAIILAHTFYNVPICIRIISATWSTINRNIEKAAMSLGAGPVRRFINATLPQIWPGIVSSASLVFIFCFTSFAVVLVLGGGPKYSTMEVEIYRLAKVSLDLKGASALAIIEASFSIAFMFLYLKIQESTRYIERRAASAETIPLINAIKSKAGVLVIIYFLAMVFLVISPMASSVYYSFLKRSGWGGRLTHTLDWYIKIFTGQQASLVPVRYLGIIKNSIFFGIVTIGVSLPIGLSITYYLHRVGIRKTGLINALLMLPLGVSSIILGFGYIRAYQLLPWDMTGRWYAIGFAHSVVAYPFVIRTLSTVMRKINPSYLNAARSLGAGPWRCFWHVEFPIIKPGVVAAATFAFAISIGEINATIMLYNPRYITLPIAIYRMIASYNYFGACALGTILIGICVFVFIVIDKMGFEIQ